MKKLYKFMLAALFTIFSFIPFTFNVFAYNLDSITIPGLIGVYQLSSTSDTSRQFRFRLTTSTDTTPFDQYIGISEFDGSYELLNTSVSDVVRFRVGTASVPIDFVFRPELYDYYILASVHTNDLTHTFVPNRAQVYTYYEDANEYNSYSLLDVSVLHESDSNTTGFSLLGKLPDSIDNSFICNLYLDGNAGIVGSNVSFQGLIFMFEKGSQNSTSNIITAINNNATKVSNAITSSGNQITNSVNSVNTSMVSGNSTSQNVESSVDSVTDSFDLVSGQYEQYESQFNSNLTSSLDNIDLDSVNLVNSSDFVKTASWVKVQFDDVLDNSGIYKTSITFVLIIGLALLLLGRRL